MYIEKLKEFEFDDDINKKLSKLIEDEVNKKSIEYEDKIKNLKVDFYVENALKNAKAKNNKAVKALLDFDDIEFGEDGSINKIDKQIKKLSTDNETSFLFDNAVNLKGLVPAEASKISSKPPEQMTYTELKAYYENGGQ